MLDFFPTFIEFKTSFTNGVYLGGLAWVSIKGLEVVATKDFQDTIAKAITPDSERLFSSDLRVSKNSIKNQNLPNWIQQFQGLLDAFFGKKHLSLKCFLKSCLVSLLSAFTLLIVFLGGELLDVVPGSDEWILFLFFGATLNFIPDFISLYESRLLISFLSNKKSNFLCFTILFFDLILTTIIISSWFWFIAIVFDVLSFDERIELFIDIIFLKGDAISFSVFFYSTFSTSVWLWFYAFAFYSTKVIMSFRGGHKVLSKVFDFKSKPVGSLAYIAGFGIFFLSFIGSIAYFSFTGDLPVESI